MLDVMEDNQAGLQPRFDSDGKLDNHKHTSPLVDEPRSGLILGDFNGSESAKHEINNNGKQNLAAKEVGPDSVIATTPMSFPQFSNDAPSTPGPSGSQTQSEDEDEELTNSQFFPKSTSPVSAVDGKKGGMYQKAGEEELCQMHRFRLYETASRYYLVGADVGERKFRILKVDRTVDSGELSIAEDDIVYTKKELSQLLETVKDGNRSTGGMKLKCTMWGLLGFIRFTGAYYMLLITKRKHVAMIGGHYIYQVDGTELISLTMPSSRFKVDRDAEEARFVGILNNLDLTRSFYFSYFYDITCTLQNNMLRERQNLEHGKAYMPLQYQNAMFIWNHHLLDSASTALKNTYDWCLPIVHGFVRQSSTSSFICLGLRHC